MDIIAMKIKPRTDTSAHFGKRLAQLRKSKGVTQVELAQKIGCTQRVVAYYESESEHIPTNLLVPIAKALKVSVDELVGLKNESLKTTNNAALWRKLKKAEGLPPKERKTLIDLLNVLLSKSGIS